MYSVPVPPTVPPCRTPSQTSRSSSHTSRHQKCQKSQRSKPRQGPLWMKAIKESPVKVRVISLAIMKYQWWRLKPMSRKPVKQMVQIQMKMFQCQRTGACKGRTCLLHRKPWICYPSNVNMLRLFTGRPWSEEGLANFSDILQIASQH